MTTSLARLGTLVLILLLATSRFVCGAPSGVDLSQCDGWEIVVDAAAIPSELYAAEEFQQHFQQATGRQLPIVNRAGTTTGHVLIGMTDALQQMAPEINVDKFGAEDFRIMIGDAKIVIVGGQPRGTLYGVYTFLEDYLGVRFLTHDHTHVPKYQSHIVGPVDREYHPTLGFRWSFYGENSAHPAFATRRRVNTITSDPTLGGKTGRRLINHTFGRQIPSATYGDEHPEYYCEIDGQRRAKVEDDFRDNEPCLTNPEVLKIVTASALAELKADPTVENISISQNDNDKYCRCEKCAAVDEREGTPMGSLLSFVNAAAAEIEKDFPHVKVGTLSYWYTRQPPRTLKPRDNVQIQLCSIECCLIHPIDDPNCPLNVRFCDDMKQWGEICHDIAIWNYNTNFRNYLLPCPNLRVIEPNVRYFVANQAQGIFMQAAGNARGAELSDLRNYVISNLLWDLNRKGDELVDEFLTLHYAEGAAPIREFIQLVHNTAEESGLHKNCFGTAAQYGLNESTAAAGMAAFAKAMQLAPDDAVRSRVAKASISAYRLAIEPVWNLGSPADLNDELKQRMRPLVREFFELCEAHDVTNVSEYQTVAQAKQHLRNLFQLADGESF